MYEVTYPNGTVGYYHVECVDRLRELCERKGKDVPYFCMELEEILRYDVDRWREVNDFIKPLVEKKLSNKRIIAEIASRFNCSHTTAWRKLKTINKNLP